MTVFIPGISSSLLSIDSSSLVSLRVTDSCTALSTGGLLLFPLFSVDFLFCFVCCILFFSWLFMVLTPVLLGFVVPSWLYKLFFFFFSRGKWRDLAMVTKNHHYICLWPLFRPHDSPVRGIKVTKPDLNSPWELSRSGSYSTPALESPVGFLLY